MYTYTFLILIDLSKVSIQDSNYKSLLDIFGSISLASNTILNLALSTREKINKTKYIVYCKSPTKVYVRLKSSLIDIFARAVGS